MVHELRSFLGGDWVAGSGSSASLLNPATEEVVAETSTAGLDLAQALAYARDVGGPAIRRHTLQERGEWLRKMATLIYDHRDDLIEKGMINAGNTRGDAKFDVDGASAVLQYYGELARDLGDGPWLRDGDPITLGTSNRLAGQHLFVPIEGVAVLINAYNFPAWGMIEKAACAWLAGVPVLTKPATSTAWMAHRLVECILDAKILPEGALSLLAGAANDLLQHVDERDAVAFTGSASTGAWIRELANVREKSVRLNVEADSLNAAVLGPDVDGDETYDLFVNDLFRDLTQKTGQKCTAIRRIFVPEAKVDRIKEALIARLQDLRMGDPSIDGVRMGPIASGSALKAVREGLAKLEGAASIAWRGPDQFERRDGFGGKGFFVAPTLFEVAAGAAADAVHEVEVFGPSSTLIPYRSTDELLALVRRGAGGLVASIYTDDRAFLKASVAGMAASHGRLYLGSKKMAGSAPGPGTALPQLKHGGPGRAGGGEEMAGIRGLHFYMQRVALEGYGPLIEWLIK